MDINIKINLTNTKLANLIGYENKVEKLILSKKIINIIVTGGNGEFENKIKIPFLSDKYLQFNYFLIKIRGDYLNKLNNKYNTNNI